VSTGKVQGLGIYRKISTLSEFEILNLSDGISVQVFYNNFTITPVGFPPGLPQPGPGVYSPVVIASGYLIYTTIFGRSELFGARI